MIVEGKAVFKCPQTAKEVTLHECINSDGKGKPCSFYSHYGLLGVHPYVCCNYDEFTKYKTDAQESKTKDASDSS